MAAAPSRDALTFRLGLSTYWLIAPLLGFLAAATGAVCYLLSSYEGLARWYTGLNPCFYNSQKWQQTFFTPQTFERGRVFAGLALAVSALAAVGTAVLLRKKRTWQLRLHLNWSDRYAIAVLWIFQTAIWIYGMRSCVPGYDEVFSAMNCAGMHPFQCASYYMLPNNHVFFNVLNSFVSRLWSDPLQSARIISAITAFALTPLLYLWIRSRRAAVIPAALICAVVLLQFPVWAFSFQGRGYSLYLLCAWTAFISVQYYFETGNRAAWLPHIVATVVGFWTMPSYLYWELAIGLYSVIEMLRARRLDIGLFGVMAVSAALVFLVYTPLLCFSGLPALAENRYVVTREMPLLKFLPELRSSVISSVQYTFNGFVDHRNLVYIACFAIPFLLTPFMYRRRIFTTLLFAWISWGVLILAVLYSKRYPFPRNQIAHVSLCLGSFLLLLNELLAVLPARFRRWRTVFVAVVCLVIGVHFARFNREHIHDSIYFYQAETRYKTLNAAAVRLPEDAVVWVSAEGFYWQYLCRKRGLRASMCERSAAATHYIYIPTEETLPAEIRGRVEHVDRADEYEVLRILR